MNFNSNASLKCFSTTAILRMGVRDWRRGGGGGDRKTPKKRKNKIYRKKILKKRLQNLRNEYIDFLLF